MSSADPPGPEPSPRRPGLPWFRWLLAAVVVAALVVFYTLGGQHYLSFQFLHDHLSRWRSLAQEHLLAALLIYFAIYVTVTALSLPAAALLSMVGGALFGTWLATGLVALAATTGATLAFLTSRYLFRDWVQRRFGSRLRAINQGVEREGAYFLFVVRLVPLFPFFLVNLAMGLTPLRVWTFAWVSLLGMLPGTFVFVNAGSAATLIEKPSDLFTPQVLGSFALLALLPLVLRLVMGWLRSGRPPDQRDKPAGSPDSFPGINP